MQAFYEKYRNEEVVLLTINIMQNETIEGIKEFMEQGGYSMPVPLDVKGEAASLYGVRGHPVTYFIDTEGYIRYRHLGPITLEQLERYLKKL